eukprot:scaffold21112_cov139-Skeletonema_marinoi.AAC.1
MKVVKLERKRDNHNVAVVDTMDGPQIDDEEVSLSNSSLGSYDDIDTSDDEEEELEESIDLISSSSLGGGASSSSDGEKDGNGNNDKSTSQDKRLSLRRHHTVAHLPPRPGRDKQQQRATFHAFGNDDYRKATKLDQKVSLEGVNSTLSAEVLNQHVLLSQACLELLEERDRYDAMRKLNLRRSLNCTREEEADFMDEEDEEYPLLSLIKSGPLYKLHIKGGTATKKIRSKKHKLKSKLARSTSADVVGGRSTTESSLLTSWKHKYVEVRKGMLSYYANTTTSLPTKSDLVRKNVTLEVSTSVCRAINLEEGDNIHPFESKDTKSSSLPPTFGKKKETHLYAFELVVNGETRVWASRSEAGRQSWIKVINRGMIGRSVKEDVSRKKNDPNAERQLQEFLALSKKRAKNFSKEAKDVSEVGQEFSVLWGTSVEVPVKSLFADERMLAKTPQTAPKDELAGFWRNLESLTIELNGKLFQASSLCCPQRVFGFLTRSILEHDRHTALLHQNQSTKISEIQASKHARDVLRSIGKHDENISHLRASVGVLCGDTNDAVVVEDDEDELPIIKINVASNMHQISSVQPNLRVDRRDWVYVRRKKNKNPRRYFAVLSVGVLCFYKEELPRPHRLKSQLLLVGAHIGTREQSHPIEFSSHTNEDVSSHSSGYHSSNLSNDTPASPSMKNPNYILCIKGREDGKWVEQQLCFTKYETYVAWRDVLVNAIETSSSHSNVLSFDGANEQSTDEVQAIDQTTTPPRTSGPDVNGVSWISLSVASTAGDLHVHSSRLQNMTLVRAASRFFESLPPLQISSPKFSDRKHSYPASLLSSAASIASKQLSRKTLHSRASSSDLTTPTTAEDTLEKTSRATVEIEVQMTKWYTVFLNDAVGPSMCTIRSTHTERFACSGGKKGGLEKKQELVKLETLRGKVNKGAFRLAFDSKSVPRRRKTI